MTNSAITPKRVLFLCAHNSARSQMAEGLLRAYGNNAFISFSAGTVATQVRPKAIVVMREIGIDITQQESKTLSRYRQEPFDIIITVCDSVNESCPIFPNARQRWHWSIHDPSTIQGTEDERLAAFRQVRDELRRRIETEILSPPGR